MKHGVERHTTAQREPIQLLAFRHGCFPGRFSWRGRDYTTDAVERAWTETGTGGLVRSYRFRVRCGGTAFDLLQDAASRRWYRVRGKAL